MPPRPTVPSRPSVPSSPSANEHSAACHLCEAICGLRVTVIDDVITSIKPNREDPLSRGHICPKALSLQDLRDDPDRLRQPMRRIRRQDGVDEWQPMRWEAALEYAITGLSDVAHQHGRNAVALYLGNPTVHSLGGLTHGPAFARVLRTKNTYSATSMDQLPLQFTALQMYGHQLLIPVPDIDRTDLLLVVGGNPMASNGSLWTVPDFPQRVRDLKARGGRLIVIDPRRTETARVASEHHFVRPGTDAWVLLAMVRIILDEGLATPSPYATGLAELKSAVAQVDPAVAATHSGIPEETIRELARAFAAAPAAAAYGRLGTCTQEFGTLSTWAIQALNLVTGNLDREGGVLFPEPAVDIISRGLMSKGGQGRWTSRVRGLPEFGGELPISVLGEEIETPGQGQVRALVTMAGNPVLSSPAGGRLESSLEGLDFMVAIDVYLNETTRHADVIFPTSVGLERDHYDLAFHVLAVRNTARFTSALVSRPPGVRHDWEIFRDLGLGLLATSAYRQPLRKRLALAARLRTSPTRALDLLLRSARRGLSVAKLRRSPNGVDLGALRPTLPGRLQTTDQRVSAAPPVIVADLPRLLASSPLEGLLLIGRRHQRDNNSWMHNLPILTKGRARHQLWIHPDDAAARGVADGERVEVRSAAGQVSVAARVTGEVMVGVVSLPHGYGHEVHAAASGPGMQLAREVPGASVNDLVDPSRVDVSGNAVANGVPVEVRAL